MKPTAAELEQYYDTLSYFVDRLTVLWGKMGRGKTTCAVAMAYWMRDLFQLPVISVGTTIGFRDPFGPFTHMPVEDFLKQMLLISQISDEIIAENIPQDDIDNHLLWYKKEKGLKLYRCVLLFDELYKYCDARRPHSPVNKSIQDFVAQMRHYHVTFIGMAPRMGQIDRRMREDQVHWSCRPDSDENRWYTLQFIGPDRPLTIRIYGPRYAGKYPEDPNRMFNSWAFTGFNAKLLEKALAKGI